MGMMGEESTTASVTGPVIVFGHSLFYAWYLTVVCTFSVGYPPGGGAFPAVVSQFSMLLGAALSTIALSHGAPAGFFGRKHYTRGTSAAAFAVGCLPCLLVVADVDGGGSLQTAFAVLLFASGVGAVYFFSAWEDLTMECGLGNPIVSTATAFTLGVLLFAVSSLFPLRQAAILSLLYLLSSTGMLMVVGRTAHKGGEPGGDLQVDGEYEPRSDPSDGASLGKLRANVLFFLISLCSGMVLSLCSALDQELLGRSFFIGAALCAAALALYRATKRVVRIETLEMLVAVLIVMAFILVLAVRSEAAVAAATCVILAAWTVFRAFNGGLNMNRAIRLGQSSVRYMAASNISINLGLPTGCLIACFMLYHGPRGEMLVGACAALSMLLVASCFAADPAGRDGGGQGKPSGGSQSFDELMRKCMLVAEAHQLSPREGEVLCYLARGRSAKRIADDLVVSEHTVKSHVYRIYKKVGVHTRQELIDLVEEEPIRKAP